MQIELLCYWHMIHLRLSIDRCNCLADLDALHKDPEQWHKVVKFILEFAGLIHFLLCFTLFRFRCSLCSLQPYLCCSCQSRSQVQASYWIWKIQKNLWREEKYLKIANTVWFGCYLLQRKSCSWRGWLWLWEYFGHIKLLRWAKVSLLLNEETLKKKN